MESKKLKAFGYARVSTDKQDLERQKTLITECVKDRDYELIDILKDTESGASNSRDGLIDLMKLTKEVCDIVIVSELSRLSREDDIMEVLFYINQTIKKGIGILFIDDATKIYQNKLDLIDIIRLAVGAEQAAKEREKITERLKTGMDVKYNDTPNAYRGAILPIGFKAVDNPQYIPITDKKNFIKLYAKKIVVLDETKEEFINEIFNLVISGKTLRDIAIIMNDRGLKTTKGKTFTESTISAIIKNPMYNGIIKRNKKNYELGFKIIDNKRFNLANKRLTENQIFKNKGNKNFNPLKGIAKCPCGYGLMINQINRKDAPNYFVMTCVGKKQLKEKGKCTNGGIDSTLFYSSIWETVSLRLVSSNYHTKNNERIKELNNEIERLRGNIISFIKDIETKENDKQTILKRLEVLTDDELIKITQTNFIDKNLEIEAINMQIKDTKSKITEIESTIISIGNNYKSNFYNEVSEEEKQMIYKSEIESVIYYSTNQFKGYIHINYKNGSENIIAVKKNKPRYSILLPDHFKFNTENRNIEYTAYEEYKGEGFGLGKSTTEILEFDNIAENNFGEYLEVEEKN